MRRMYAYLMRQRHIDREVISYFVHEKLLYEDKHHNCVSLEWMAAARRNTPTSAAPTARAGCSV